MAEHSGRNVVMFSVMAGLAGTVVGLLMAPRSGQQTRAQIRHKASEVKGQAHQKVEAGREKAEHLKERLAEAASNTGKKAKEEFKQGKEALKEDERVRSPALRDWEEEV